jgi:hypothetical protein
VDLASAATLAPLYETGLREHLWEAIPAENGLRTAVFIVGGSSSATLAGMEEYKEILRRDLQAGKASWDCFCDGYQVTVPKTKN